MIICLDIGNTHIYGGVLKENEIKLRFRYPSTFPCTSDTFGIFLKDVLEKNSVDSTSIQAISLCSVVPSLDYSIVSACKKYFNITPLELKPGVKTGVKLAIKNPLELGADRLANAVAAVNAFPNKNIIVVDFGTATTLCTITKDKTYIGGAILPGLKLSMESLSSKAAKLAAVEIVAPTDVLGKSTEVQLQSGLYYGQLGAIKELTQQIIQTSLANEETLLLSTGGYAHLFEKAAFFTVNMPDLVLHGLRLIWEKNQ